MKFAIITHVAHIQKENEYFAYAPYVREMNIWLKYVDDVIIVAPLESNEPKIIDIPYKHSRINFKKVSDFSFVTFKKSLFSILKLPRIFWEVFWAMKDADHIHLRCPGNMGLIGCLVQVLFPKKEKTAKYAGNWDPKSKQPYTYKLQKWMLSNTFLTRNMKVLVYGDWENQSKNNKPFFTATYSESEKETVQKTSFDQEIKFIFAGSLVLGKNPMYAIQFVEKLHEKGYKATLNFYGEGSERISLENYIRINNLGAFITLNGNVNQEALKSAYQESHFVILPSKSEGWPKAIAEGMFWGCVPIATSVSCVPFMLDYGERGILLKMILEKDTAQIDTILKSELVFKNKSKKALEWSQKYTIDVFDKEIKKLLDKKT